MFTSNSHFCISEEDVKKPTGAAVVIFPSDDLIFRISCTYQPDCMSLFYSPLVHTFRMVHNFQRSCLFHLIWMLTPCWSDFGSLLIPENTNDVGICQNLCDCTNCRGVLLMLDMNCMIIFPVKILKLEIIEEIGTSANFQQAFYAILTPFV